ncbi:glutamate racemase [Cohnella sp. OV330]|uniref:glutamate racemase n=1 Tax=Cohnella sp. OV330 TaxID=1855288 RepID=UPI0008F023B8|nr:glutamate racemase [Cohnella sp. OV330]SFB33495.1 glutamate racemase [Cohnella sp. OV330]
MQQAIAVLDSGVGGLTVVKEVMRQLPREKILYFGDTARTPYGSRSAEQVVEFTREIVDYLVQFNPKMIVIACNTATAVALEDITGRVSVPVVGVIGPGARAALGRTRTGVIGVIGTEGTIRSGAYEAALNTLSGGSVQVVSRACPGFVPLVEDGNFRSERTQSIVESSLAPLRGKHLDSLILGCTHYPFLADAISEAMEPGVALISSADETAREIRSILERSGQLAEADGAPLHQFFCSGDPVKFREIAQTWLGEQIRLTPVVWQVPHIGA